MELLTGYSIETWFPPHLDQLGLYLHLYNFFLSSPERKPFWSLFPYSGLQHGDTLSHFLFIIGSEAISRLLYSNLRGFKIARSCALLNHLFFADDLVIFTTATFGEASLIKSCLDKYGHWSGQMVNIQKSNILFSKNIASATITAIHAILPYDRTPVSAKHLGLSLLIGQSKSAAFSDILDKVQGKIEGWRSKSLSWAGKNILVKVVASAMSSFLLPDGFCRTLDKAFKNFLWGFPKDKSCNPTLKSWRSLCLSKDQGGLGFRLMKYVNLFLISKLG
jgi:hypothetical protein